MRPDVETSVKPSLIHVDSNKILVKGRQVWDDSSSQHDITSIQSKSASFCDLEKPFVQSKSFLYSKVYALSCTKHVNICKLCF